MSWRRIDLDIQPGEFVSIMGLRRRQVNVAIESGIREFLEDSFDRQAGDSFGKTNQSCDCGKIGPLFGVSDGPPPRRNSIRQPLTDRASRGYAVALNLPAPEGP